MLSSQYETKKIPGTQLEAEPSQVQYWLQEAVLKHLLERQLQVGSTETGTNIATLYHTKFSQVFNFVNFTIFQPFTRIFQQNFFSSQDSFHTLTGGASMESIINSIQGDAFKVGIALLIGIA